MSEYIDGKHMVFVFFVLYLALSVCTAAKPALNCHWASPVLAGVSSPGSNSFSDPKKFTTEMLSILLIVALFKGSAALACEGDQVQTSSCYYCHLKIS